jgi:phosphoribosylanthranilate isomerase
MKKSKEEKINNKISKKITELSKIVGVYTNTDSGMIRDNIVKCLNDTVQIKKRIKQKSSDQIAEEEYLKDLLKEK